MVTGTGNDGFTFNASIDGTDAAFTITNDMFLEYDSTENGGNGDGILDETEFAALLTEGLGIDNTDGDGVIDENDKIESYENLMMGLGGTALEDAEDTGTVDTGTEDMGTGDTGGSCSGK